MIRKTILWLIGSIFVFHVMFPLLFAMWELNEAPADETKTEGV